jgi:hypothetical protein
MKTSARIVGVQGALRTKHLQNECEECYRYTEMLGILLTCLYPYIRLSVSTFGFDVRCFNCGCRSKVNVILGEMAKTISWPI